MLLKFLALIGIATLAVFGSAKLLGDIRDDAPPQVVNEEHFED
jgi:hypothetical protein